MSYQNTTQATPTGRTLSRAKQTIEHYNISHMTLWRWRQCPTFPQPLKRGRVVLYDVAAIEHWLSEGA